MDDKARNRFWLWMKFWKLGTLTRQKLLELAALENISLFFELHWVGKHKDPPCKFYSRIKQTLWAVKGGEKSCMINRNWNRFLSSFLLCWHHKIDATDTCTYVKQVFCFDPPIHPSLPPSHLYLCPFCSKELLLFIFCPAQLQTFSKFAVELFGLSRIRGRPSRIFFVCVCVSHGVFECTSVCECAFVVATIYCLVVSVPLLFSLPYLVLVCGIEALMFIFFLLFCTVISFTIPA